MVASVSRRRLRVQDLAVGDRLFCQPNDTYATVTALVGQWAELTWEHNSQTACYTGYDLKRLQIAKVNGAIAGSTLQTTSNQGGETSNNTADNNQIAIIKTPAESITTHPSPLDSLITEINTLFGNLEEAEEVAENAAQSAFAFALEIGHKLIKAKAECGHGNWEATRAQIKSPRSGKPLPSSTATLYQRVAENKAKLDQAGVRTLRDAAQLLKIDRQLKSATAAETPNAPIVVERDLADSLEQLKERFDANQAAAEANHKPSITPAEGQQEAPSFNWSKPDLEPIAPTTITPDTQAVIQQVCAQFGALTVIEAALKLCSESEAARAYTLASLKRYGKVLN